MEADIVSVPSHGHAGEGSRWPCSSGLHTWGEGLQLIPHTATIPSSAPGAAFLVPSSPHRIAATGAWGWPSPHVTEEVESRARGVLGAATVCPQSHGHGDRDGGGLCWGSLCPAGLGEEAGAVWAFLPPLPVRGNYSRQTPCTLIKMIATQEQVTYNCTQGEL